MTIETYHPTQRTKEVDNVLTALKRLRSGKNDINSDNKEGKDETVT